MGIGILELHQATFRIPRGPSLSFEIPHLCEGHIVQTVFRKDGVFQTRCFGGTFCSRAVSQPELGVISPPESGEVDFATGRTDVRNNSPPTCRLILQGAHRPVLGRMIFVRSFPSIFTIPNFLSFPMPRGPAPRGPYRLGPSMSRRRDTSRSTHQEITRTIAVIASATSTTLGTWSDPSGLAQASRASTLSH